MARVTHVKRAQQRYATVPVLDENDQPKRIPLKRKNGQPVKTKTGREVTIAVTREDRTKPKPPANCDHCHKPIEVGTPYKWVKPKSGPYGGARRSRHASCPTWQVWELSNSLDARIQQATNDFDVSQVESEDDVTSALEAVAEQIRELAAEKEEAASNMEEGFGHPTGQSEELAEQAQTLEDWADEIESVEVPELAAADDVDCEDCDGTGQVDVEDVDEDDEDAETEEECSACGGTGQVESDEEPDLDAWREEVEEAVAIVWESPL
jgi:hypothetical protein